jgi:hypothetical protein
MNIKTLLGTFEIKYDSHETVLQLTKRIALSSGILVGQFHLIFKGVTLKDDLKVSHYEIQKFSTLYLVLHVPYKGCYRCCLNSRRKCRCHRLSGKMNSKNCQLKTFTGESTKKKKERKSKFNIEFMPLNQLPPCAPPVGHSQGKVTLQVTVPFDSRCQGVDDGADNALPQRIENSTVESSNIYIGQLMRLPTLDRVFAWLFGDCVLF